MTLGVLKNRLLQMTQGAFNEGDLGYRTFRDLLA